MLVDDVFVIKGRPAPVACVTLDGPEPQIGTVMARASDGATWEVIGIEWWAIPRRPAAGDVVGLLLRGDVAIQKGDSLAAKNEPCQWCGEQIAVGNEHLRRNLEAVKDERDAARKLLVAIEPHSGATLDLFAFVESCAKPLRDELARVKESFKRCNRNARRDARKATHSVELRRENFKALAAKLATVTADRDEKVKALFAAAEGIENAAVEYLAECKKSAAFHRERDEQRARAVAAEQREFEYRSTLVRISAEENGANVQHEAGAMRWALKAACASARNALDRIPAPGTKGALMRSPEWCSTHGIFEGQNPEGIYRSTCPACKRDTVPADSLHRALADLKGCADPQRNAYRDQVERLRGRAVQLEELLRVEYVDQASDRTWCRRCRTEHMWPNGNGDRGAHVHKTTCVLATSGNDVTEEESA